MQKGPDRKKSASKDHECTEKESLLAQTPIVAKECISTRCEGLYFSKVVRQDDHLDCGVKAEILTPCPDA